LTIRDEVDPLRPVPPREDRLEADGQRGQPRERVPEERHPFGRALRGGEAVVEQHSGGSVHHDVNLVTDGQNVVFLQAKDDAPLAFREKRNGLWLANRFRLYADLRRDPRRGREQADNLRREVIGF
jgi:hypothetical protein